MLPEGRFAVILASIATVFVLSLVGMFSTYMFLKKDAKFSDEFNIFKALGTGKQFKGLNNAVSR